MEGRGVGWRVVGLLNEEREKRGLGPLPWEKAEEILRLVRGYVSVEDKADPAFKEAVEAAQAALSALGQRLSLTEGDLVLVARYWHGKGKLSEEALYLLEPLLLRGRVPSAPPEVLREHVMAFAERVQRTFSGRSRLRRRRIGIGERWEEP